MKIRNEKWAVSDFLHRRRKIESQPVYQRGPVWTLPKRSLLIDSIMRGLDVPKIYLRELLGNPMFDYQVVDGQQRLTSIWCFGERDGFRLSLPEDLEDAEWANESYQSVNASYRKRFRKFELIVAVVTDASDEDIRDLFARLQMGERLTPAELRNSIASAIGTEVRNIAENHRFFANCVFSSARYKHHDLAAHAFALELGKGREDVKAPNLREMYIRFAESLPGSVSSKVAKTLDYLDEVQAQVPGVVNRKWGFVDLYLLISSTKSRDLPSAEILANRYKKFEEERRPNAGRPERLLAKRTPDKRLYEYILAFQLRSGESEQLRLRNAVLRTRLLNGKKGKP